MSIQSDIQITNKGDAIELNGFTGLGDESDMLFTLRKGKCDKVLGTHVLQFLFLGLTEFRFPFAHFVTDQIQAPELYHLFWDAVDNLSVHGFKILYTSMDGAQSNRTLMDICTKTTESSQTTFTSISLSDTNEVIFMMDVSHVLKKIRNNILKSGIKSASTRILTLQDDYKMTVLFNGRCSLIATIS